MKQDKHNVNNNFAFPDHMTDVPFDVLTQILYDDTFIRKLPEKQEALSRKKGFKMR